MIYEGVTLDGLSKLILEMLPLSEQVTEDSKGHQGVEAEKAIVGVLSATEPAKRLDVLAEKVMIFHLKWCVFGCEERRLSG